MSRKDTFTSDCLVLGHLNQIQNVVVDLCSNYILVYKKRLGLGKVGIIRSQFKFFFPQTVAVEPEERIFRHILRSLKKYN